MSWRESKCSVGISALSPSVQYWSTMEPTCRDLSCGQDVGSRADVSRNRWELLPSCTVWRLRRSWHEDGRGGLSAVVLGLSGCGRVHSSPVPGADQTPNTYLMKKSMREGHLCSFNLKIFHLLNSLLTFRSADSISLLGSPLPASSNPLPGPATAPATYPCISRLCSLVLCPCTCRFIPRVWTLI